MCDRVQNFNLAVKPFFTQPFPFWWTTECKTINAPEKEVSFVHFFTIYYDKTTKTCKRHSSLGGGNRKKLGGGQNGRSFVIHWSNWRGKTSCPCCSPSLCMKAGFFHLWWWPFCASMETFAFSWGQKCWTSSFEAYRCLRTNIKMDRLFHYIDSQLLRLAFSLVNFFFFKSLKQIAIALKIQTLQLTLNFLDKLYFDSLPTEDRRVFVRFQQYLYQLMLTCCYNCLLNVCICIVNITWMFSECFQNVSKDEWNG